MISAEQIGAYIKDPTALTVSKLVEFKEVLNKYPYCSSLYLIYLNGLSKSNHIQFEDELKIGAAHVMDREHLHALINEDELEEVSTEIIERLNEVDRTNKIQKKPESQIVENLEFKIEKVSEQKTKEESIITEEKITESSLDEDILSHAIGIAFEHSGESLITEKTEKDLQEKETVSAQTEKIEEVEKNEVISPPKDMSFIEWLKYKQTIIESGQKTSETSLDLLKDTENPLSKKEINQLLDRFIAEEPSISRPEKEFFNPTKTATKSVEESLDITSETLAKIHEMQGNYNKAIASYKQLILLYPEKKAFFASQIEKIKNK